MDAITFPPIPLGADKNILKPSQDFTKEIYKAIGAVFLFLFTYLFILAGSIALAVAFCFLGVIIMTLKIGFVTLICGVGLIITGFMLIYFVLKFLFKRDSIDLSGFTEIKKADEPVLFAFIQQITEEVGAPMPKKVFITPEVNAAVFYNSTNWSMFFPARKNLKIGLGLVNSLNISEFKAVMGHEFGHFSQKSMRFGSYFYNFNKIIYNMLYENKTYHNILNSYSKIHKLLTLFAYLNLYLVKGIQELLKKVHQIINRINLSLSQQMEFHADAVAAYVGGSNQAINSLRRIEFANSCYQILLDFLDIQFKDKKRAINIYDEQLEVMKYYAQLNKINLDDNRLPIINKEINEDASSQIYIEDKWSTHPSKLERELSLQEIKVNAVADNRSAWLLFSNPSELQVKITYSIYQQLKMDDTSSLTTDEFTERFNKFVNPHAYNKLFKDFYDNRELHLFDLNNLSNSIEHSDINSFENLLSDENCKLPIILNRMKNDISLLESFIEFGGKTDKFYYKGIKYSKDEAEPICKEIEKEHTILTERLNKIDQQIFQFFYTIAQNTEDKDELKNKYAILYKYQELTHGYFDAYWEMKNLIQPLYNVLMPKEIISILSVVYSKETQLKNKLKRIINDESFVSFITEEELKDIDKYLKNDWIYYHKPDYDNFAFEILQKALNAFFSCLWKCQYESKNTLIEFQSKLYHQKFVPTNL